MRHAPTFGPYSAHERPCRSSTPARSVLPIGPMPGAESSVQPSSMTLTEIASGLSGQPAGSFLAGIMGRSRSLVTGPNVDNSKRKVDHSGTGDAHDRRALLADTERLQDHHHARGMRPAVQDRAGEHRHGRAVQARVPEDRKSTRLNS